MRPETLLEYPNPLIGSDGAPWIARACGRPRADGLWEGWIEFERSDGASAVRTPRETTQPNHTDLMYWASGVGQVYLEGAFRRATEPTPVRVAPPVSPPAFEGPADEGEAAAAAVLAGRPVAPLLDPFDAYASGEQTLRDRLNALASWHLRNIVRAYAIAPETLVLETMSKPDLVEIIVRAARESAAAQSMPT